MLPIRAGEFELCIIMFESPGCSQDKVIERIFLGGIESLWNCLAVLGFALFGGEEGIRTISVVNQADSSKVSAAVCV